MSIAAPQSSATRRPITLQTRGDLAISTSVFQGETSWIVKDPIALKYFRLRKPEHEVLRMLDGQTSLEDIRLRLAGMFPTKKFEARRIQALIQSFHGNGLLLSSASGQATPLERRRTKMQQQKAMQLLSSIICIRFPGVDPEPLLAWLYPKIAWFFSRTAIAVCLCIVAAALMLVATNLDEFLARLPSFQQFFGFNNLIYMGLVLVLTKSIHELGHGLVCKHFDGECHEMGFMLMVMTPAMYCDTSDSWILPNKWHRIAIGAAGMWVEVVMAAIATFVWWFTHPGWLHYLALNIMFLSSVATIVFNINPLLRYDGYYMLSDYLEIPNLSQKANLALTNVGRVWCLGMEPQTPDRLPQQKQWSFAVYSVASFFYRWFVMLMIFWFLTKVFEPFGLQALGYFAILVSVSGSIGIPLFRAIQFFTFPGRMREIKSKNLKVALLVVGLALAAFLFVPVPHHVAADFVLRPTDAQSLFVQSPGRLTEIGARYGESIKKGQTIAMLEDPKLEIRIMELQSELERQETLTESWRLNDKDPLEAARLAGEARAKIAQLKQQLADRQTQSDQLTMVADRDGYLMAPPNVPAQPVGQQLSKWTGTPLEDRNLSAVLSPNTLVGYVGESDDLSAMLCVPQEDLRFLQADQRVYLTLNAARGLRMPGSIESVSNRAIDSLPRELSATNGGPLPPMAQADGTEKPMLTLFEAAVTLRDSEATHTLMPGMTGKAKIVVGRAPLANQLYRQFMTVFRFR